MTSPSDREAYELQDAAPAWRRLERGVGLVVVLLVAGVMAAPMIRPGAPESASPPPAAADTPVVSIEHGTLQTPMEAGSPPEIAADDGMARLMRLSAIYLALIFLGGLLLMREQRCLLDLAWWTAPAMPAPAWGLWTVGKVIGVLALGQILLAHAYRTAAGSGGRIPWEIVLALIVLLYALLAVRACGRAAYAQLGLNADALLSRAWLSLRAYLAFIPVFVIVSLLSHILMLWITTWFDAGFPAEAQPVVRDLTNPQTPQATRLLLVAYAAFGAPLTEEVLIRGLLYGGLRRHCSWPAAVLISSAVFGMLHFDGYRFLPLAALGILLAVLRERTRSLTVPVCVHALHNSLMLVILYGAV